MGLLDQLKALLGGYGSRGAYRSGHTSESETSQSASSEWLDSERFAQERDALLAALGRKPERYVEGQKGWRGNPTWEDVESFFEKRYSTNGSS